MTSAPASVSEVTSLDEAMEMMDERQIRHLPVVSDGKLTGVISDRDLLEATGWLPRRVHACRGPRAADAIPSTVGELLAGRAVYQVLPEDPVLVTAVEFLHRRIGCVPVVDAQGALVGIVTELDLLRIYAERLEVAPDGVVGERMTPVPATVHWYSSIQEAIDLCKANDVRHLPVLEAGCVVGIVSDRDLRRALGSGRHGETPLEEVMTRGLVTIGPDEGLHEAARRMVAFKIGALPVAEKDELVGLLTSTDLLAHCLDVVRDQGETARGAS